MFAHLKVHSLILRDSSVVCFVLFFFSLLRFCYGVSSNGIPSGSPRIPHAFSTHIAFIFASIVSSSFVIASNRLNWPKCTQITKQQRNNDHAFIRILIVPMHKSRAKKKRKKRNRDRAQGQRSPKECVFDSHVLCECTTFFLLHSEAVR